MQLLVRRDRLNSGEVFILVSGEDKVWLWIGSDANSVKRAKGSEVVMAFYNGGGCYRAGSGIKRWGGRSRRFLGVPPGQSDGDGLDSKVKGFTPVFFRLADDMTGEIKKVATAKPLAVGPTKYEFPRFRRTNLQHKYGYLFATGFHVYIWLGIDAARETSITAITQSNVVGVIIDDFCCDKSCQDKIALGFYCFK